MTTVQLSNLFNLIVQNSSDFRFYHFGWPNDLNHNTQNNFDADGKTGDMYPYLLFIPPTISNRVQENGTQSIYRTFNCEFILTDTYGYNQQQLDLKTDTTVEVLSKLEQAARNFTNYVRQYSDYTETQFAISDAQIDLDPYRFTAQTRSIRLKFSLYFNEACPVSNLDLSFLPNDFNNLADVDIENTYT